MVVHVSFSPDPDDPFPVILPMIGSMGSFTAPSAELDEPLDCYLHGYVSSRLMRLSQQAPATSTATAEASSGSTPGLPVCIAASKVDGLVLTLTPNTHSYNYRSAVLFGHAEVVTDADEKLWAMERMTNKVVPQRWAHTRVPPTPAEMQSTQVVRVRIESASAKIRDGPPGDGRADLLDSELTERVWTGFVPLVEQLGSPVASTYNKVPEVSEHIARYVEGFNAKNKVYADKLVTQIAGKEAGQGGA